MVHPHAQSMSADASREGHSPGRFLMRELAGSLGDLGTFVPIAVGMVTLAGFDAGTVLVTAGLVSIATGLMFRIPMAVQPMKAVCALAIAGVLTHDQTLMAGLATGVCVLLLGVTGLIRKLEIILPRVLICGLQLAVAWQLLISGGRLSIGLGSTSGVISPPNVCSMVVVFAIMLGAYRILHERLEWLALGFVVGGLLLAVYADPSLTTPSPIALWHPHVHLPTLKALSGAWIGGIPQLPLTLLNSVFAVSVLAGDLFPGNRVRTTPTKIATSVGIMNLATCVLGGMPLCHGSGGLAGQYRMGARSGLSVIMLGTVKLVFGLCFGALALRWMKGFPPAILGLFLMMAGFSLADASRYKSIPGALLMAAIMLMAQWLTGSLALGFVVGCMVYWLMAIGDRERNGLWFRKKKK